MNSAGLLASLPRWRRAVRRRRRLLLGLFLACLSALVLSTLAPASTRTSPVVVAARDLPTGTEITAQDLRVVRIAEALVPVRALTDPAQAVGSRTQTPVAQGRSLTPRDLRVPGTGSLDPGRSAIVVPVDAALVPLLVPGAVVDVLAAAPDQPRADAVRATILSLPPPTAAGSTALAPGEAGAVPVVLTVDSRDAPFIAYATREGWVQVAWVG